MRLVYCSSHDSLVYFVSGNGFCEQDVIVY